MSSKTAFKPYADRDTVYTNSTYGNLSFMKPLSDSKFPVLLVKSSVTGQLYAMKMYQLSSRSYKNESRFLNIGHKYIASSLYCEDEVIESSEPQTKYSFILMEYVPRKDLCQIFLELKVKTDETLIRTYFRQLIEGISYLHSHGICHLDLKLENLMLDENFQLKIIDFDHSYRKGDEKVNGTGTSCYRAPEVFKRNCDDPEAADIFSAGVILFVMKCRESFPFSEKENKHGIDFLKLLDEDHEEFWSKHSELQKVPLNTWSREFKDLFVGMTKIDPVERFTLDEVKESKWFKGPVYSKDELSEIMRRRVRDAKEKSDKTA